MALAGLVCKHSRKPPDCSCVQVCERPMRKPRRTFFAEILWVLSCKHDLGA